MFTPLLRIIISISCLVIAFVFYSQGRFISMGLMVLASCLFIYGYFKHGTVYAASQQIKKGNFQKAENLISKIYAPNKLSTADKGYYHFVNGIIALEKSEWDKSYSELIKALNIGLRTNNDKSIVLLNLANVEFERKNYDKAKDFIKKVREFDLNPTIEFETNKIENEINVAQQRLSFIATESFKK